MVRARVGCGELRYNCEEIGRNMPFGPLGPQARHLGVSQDNQLTHSLLTRIQIAGNSGREPGWLGTWQQTLHDKSSTEYI